VEIAGCPGFCLRLQSSDFPPNFLLFSFCFLGPDLPGSSRTICDPLGLNPLILSRFKLDPRHGVTPASFVCRSGLSRYSKMPNDVSAHSLPSGHNLNLGDPERDQSPAEYSSGLDSDNDAITLNGSSGSRALKRKRPLTVSYVSESTVPRLRPPRRTLIS
jgi:hypothetical protein